MESLVCVGRLNSARYLAEGYYLHELLLFGFKPGIAMPNTAYDND